MSESKRATLSIRPGALTKEQEAAAIHAGSIAAGANALLAGGMISREQHTRILRALAPSVQPVFDALAALSPSLESPQP